MSRPLPIVDLSPFLNDGTDAQKKEVADSLIAACKDIGFVYLRGHGIPTQKVQEVFDVSAKFYDLPMDQKKIAPHPPGWAVHRGYSWPGLEKVSNALAGSDPEEVAEQLREVQDFKESYEVGSEDNPDQPNVWLPEDLLPEWRPSMSSFYWTCWDASKVILRALAYGLDIDEEVLLQPFSGHYNQLRLLHYPPVPAKYVEDGKFARMSAHTDWTIITILFQDDCGGLQVESPSQPGCFIDVDPVPDTLVLNIGDLMMRWTDDFLKSTQHRVQLPPLRDRYEDPDVTIQSLRTRGGQAAQYEPITQREYSAMRAQMQY